MKFRLSRNGVSAALMVAVVVGITIGFMTTGDDGISRVGNGSIAGVVAFVVFLGTTTVFERYQSGR